MIRLDRYDNASFDRGAGKLKEIAWNLTKYLFFLPPWPFPSSFRCALLRLFGAKVGTGVVIRSRTNITFPWRLEIGDHVWVGEEVIILSLAKVSIGNHCCLSQRAFLSTGSHDFKSEGFDLIAEPIMIGDSSWVAACAFIGPGVTLAPWLTRQSEFRGQRMRIGIVNQFAPPDESPTSVLAGELADYLRARGHDIRLISCDGGYRDRRKRRRGRLLRELRAHLSLFWKCLRYRRADVLLALSSPACLPATVATAARLKRCRFAHWAMDVYPEVAVALGEIAGKGIVFKITSTAMRRAYRRADPLVALNSRMAEAISEPAETCAPWPPKKLRWPDTPLSPSEPFTWLYSGNLGRAHLYRPLLLAQQILERKGIPAHLVFQGGGHSFPQAKALAEDLELKNCHFRDYVPREELLDSLFAADVLIATQATETDGLLWPSKLAVMRHIPRPLLWVGGGSPSVEATVFSPDDTDGIAGWVAGQLSDPPRLPYEPPPPPQQSLDLWNQWLTKK